MASIHRRLSSEGLQETAQGKGEENFMEPQNTQNKQHGGHKKVRNFLLRHSACSAVGKALERGETYGAEQAC